MGMGPRRGTQQRPAPPGGPAIPQGPGIDPGFGPRTNVGSVDIDPGFGPGRDEPGLDLSGLEGTIAEEEEIAEVIEETKRKPAGIAIKLGGAATSRGGGRRRRGESEASASQRGDAQQVIRDLKQKVRNGGKLTPEEVATLSQLRESLKRRNR